LVGAGRVLDILDLGVGSGDVGGGGDSSGWEIIFFRQVLIPSGIEFEL
jgi:hypothetical protein